MKIQVVIRTDGHPETVAGEVEADDWPELKINLPALLRSIADQFEADALDDDEA